MPDYAGPCYWATDNNPNIAPTPPYLDEAFLTDGDITANTPK